MGYRSDVVIVISTPVYEALSYVNTKLLLSVFQTVYDSNALGTVFKLDYAKWYEDLDVKVSAIMDLLDSFEVDEFGFVRVGEDNDDIEILGQPSDFGIGLIRKIEVNLLSADT